MRFAPPPGYKRIQVVGSFDELISTPFRDGINAMCWPRELPGDFEEVVKCLGPIQGITTLEDERLHALSLSAVGQIARDILLQDVERLRSADLSPNLDCIRCAPRDLSGAPIARDVYSWHADSATEPMATFLCAYNTAASEGLRNEEAIRRVEVPETRAELLTLFGGADDHDFEEFLTENFYDLHYLPVPCAQPFSFGLGNLWRIATDYPESPVPPCIHRAPTTLPGSLPRLLLIS